MFLANRKLKLIFLPFLYAILGCIIGIINGFILCRSKNQIFIVAAALAAIYISVPYSLSKRRTLYLAIMQACIICYSKLSRNNRISPILVVWIVCLSRCCIEMVTRYDNMKEASGQSTNSVKNLKNTLGRWRWSDHNINFRYFIFIGTFRSRFLLLHFNILFFFSGCFLNHSLCLQRCCLIINSLSLSYITSPADIKISRNTPEDHSKHKSYQTTPECM